MNYRTPQVRFRPPQEADQAGLLGSLTRALSECCAGKEAEIFGRSGLSAAEGHLLLTVAEQQAISPSAAAQKLGVARSRLTPLAQSLVEKGFLTRAVSKQDRRAHSLKLTPSGAAAARNVSEFRQRFHARLLESFPPLDRDRLLKALADLHERMSALREAIKDNPSNI